MTPADPLPVTGHASPPPSPAMSVDVHAFVGAYPWRHLPHPDPEPLLRVLDREGVSQSWVGHLPSAFHRDPVPGNEVLYGLLAAWRDRLHPVPAVRPDWPGWRGEVARALDEGAAAVRAYPMHWGLGVGSRALTELAAACAEHRLPLLLTVRFEDPRQRHEQDVTGDLSAAHVRALARARTGARLVVTAAGRGFVEEVHWSLTAEERVWVWWDISWLWGPPEDDLAHLLRTVGTDRFVYGSGWPLRLAQAPRANLALLPDDVAAAPLADPATW